MLERRRGPAIGAASGSEYNTIGIIDYSGGFNLGPIGTGSTDMGGHITP